MFKEKFKYYKAKWPVPDFGGVIDFESDTLYTAGVREIPLNDCSEPSSRPMGLLLSQYWKCYSLDAHPGLLVIRNPFTAQGQRYWITRCLRDYPRKPNEVNLNACLFTQSVIDDWWHSYQLCKDDKDEARRMKIAMRWTTLGYHHDWDSKVYSEQKRTQFPEDLAKLSGYISTALGFENFAAEAAIVNYYPIGTTLAGHTDHSEVNLAAPLFSFSFGQTAIFLIGGQSKDTCPSAIYLRSGDVLIMSREARLCYHAVPRVMKAKVELWNELVQQQQQPITEQCKKKLKYELPHIPMECAMDAALYQQIADELFWAPYKSYLNDSRININVRQVLPAGQATLS